MKLENLENLLPSKARAHLVEFFLAQLESFGLNWMADPVYKLTDALGDTRDAGQWARTKTVECFHEAKEAYEKKYPKGWDSHKQCSYRFHESGGAIHKIYPK